MLSRPIQLPKFLRFRDDVVGTVHNTKQNRNNANFLLNNVSFLDSWRILAYLRKKGNMPIISQFKNK